MGESRRAVRYLTYQIVLCCVSAAFGRAPETKRAGGGRQITLNSRERAKLFQSALFEPIVKIGLGRVVATGDKLLGGTICH